MVSHCSSRLTEGGLPVSLGQPLQKYNTGSDGMRHPDQERDADPNWDSTFLNTRREALIIFAVWVLAWDQPLLRNGPHLV